MYHFAYSFLNFKVICYFMLCMSVGACEVREHWWKLVYLLQGHSSPVYTRLARCPSASGQPSCLCLPSFYRSTLITDVSQRVCLYGLQRSNLGMSRLRRQRFDAPSPLASLYLFISDKHQCCIYLLNVVDVSLLMQVFKTSVHDPDWSSFGCVPI